ncbi:hypothetical protein [Desulfobacula sp.]|uniref:hypothetical protein n=1 Tax=Desulfobacula sp. TaxID=2593537 RepID=UPI002623E1E8|nr:hypothetical protein [Desulfobacula sp.]
MAVKASLKIILMADDTVVAESDDAILWQNVLVAINSGNSLVEQTITSGGTTNSGSDIDSQSDNGQPEETIACFAKELDISIECLQSACSPKAEPPYIHLDKHYWEALKTALPKRGTKAIADVIIAATILILWKDSANLGKTALKEATAVLKTLEVSANNPTRSITNCEWLQIKKGNIVLNPALTSKAINVAKAYCLKQDPNSME